MDPLRASVFVESLSLKNFRGIDELKVDFQPGLTLLVGRNNAGKSRILRAIDVAFGGAQARRDDLTIGSNEIAEIDIVIAPIDLDSTNSEQFNPEVSRRLGDGISFLSVEPQRERFAWRTTIRPANERDGARTESRVMVYGSEDEGWSLNVTARRLSREQRSLFHVEFIDTQRDIDTELRRPGSAIRQILNDLGVSDAERLELEARLSEIGTEIAEKSTTLQNSPFSSRPFVRICRRSRWGAH